MARTPKEDCFVFTFPLIVGGMPTIDGNVYSMQILSNLVERFILKPEIIVQEMNMVERKARNISLSEPWDKKIMGIVRKGFIANSTLFVECECKGGREGKKLAGLVQSLGVENVEFFPVGFGYTGEDGMISPDYKISYIAFEPKKLTRR